MGERGPLGGFGGGVWGSLGVTTPPLFCPPPFFCPPPPGTQGRRRRIRPHSCGPARMRTAMKRRMKAPLPPPGTGTPPGSTKSSVSRWDPQKLGGGGEGGGIGGPPKMGTGSLGVFKNEGRVIGGLQKMGGGGHWGWGGGLKLGIGDPQKWGGGIGEPIDWGWGLWGPQKWGQNRWGSHKLGMESLGSLKMGRGRLGGPQK